MKIVNFWFIAVFLLSACANPTVRPPTPEEEKKALQGYTCSEEVGLTQTDTSEYYSFCLHHFEQRGKALAKVLKTANPLSMCQYETRLDIDRSPAVAKEIRRRKINCKRLLAREDARQEKYYRIQQDRSEHPALYSCIDSGFKRGTQAMATCIAAWNDRQRQQEMMEQQQAQEQQQANEQKSDRQMCIGAAMMAGTSPYALQNYGNAVLQCQ